MLASLAALTFGFGTFVLGTRDLGDSQKIEAIPYFDVGKNTVLDAASSKDEKNDSSPCKNYTVTFKAHTAYVIVMKDTSKQREKSKFRPYLRLERLASPARSKGGDDVLVSDDNMHWNPDSETHLVFSCVESGDYKIIATMRRRDQDMPQGEESVRRDTERWGEMSYFLSVRPLESQSGSAKAKVTTTSWNEGFDAIHEMKPDAVRGTPAKEYLVDFKEGNIYDIEMRAVSRIFSPYLRLENPDGRQVKSASNRDIAADGFADEYTARMTYHSRVSGKFKIIATNYSGSLGKFELTVRSHLPKVRHLDTDFQTELCDQLTKGDARDSVLKFSPSKGYLFRFKPGYTYEIELRTLNVSGNSLAPPMPGTGGGWRRVAGQRSLAFDAVLRLEDDGGRELGFNDDEEAGVLRRSSTDSRLTFACERDRTYRIVATSLDSYYENIAANPHAGSGVFALSVTKTPTTSPFKDGKFSVDDGLTEGDPKDRAFKESPSKVYALHFEAGKTYDIRLDSRAGAAFNGFLRLEDASRRQLDANYDITLRNRNARIVFPCDRTGTYHIGVANVLERPGDFTLTVQSARSDAND